MCRAVRALDTLGLALAADGAGLQRLPVVEGLQATDLQRVPMAVQCRRATRFQLESIAPVQLAGRRHRRYRIGMVPDVARHTTPVVRAEKAGDVSRRRLKLVEGVVGSRHR